MWAATGQATVARVDSRSGAPKATVAVGNEPAGIAVGAGSTWVADDLDNTVSRIDAAGEVTATVPVGDGASGIAVGAGAVWVADASITPSRASTRPPPHQGRRSRCGRPRSIAAVGLGSVWVADSRDGTVSAHRPAHRSRAGNPGRRQPRGHRGRRGPRVGQRPGRRAPAGPDRGGTLRVVQKTDFGSTDPALLWSYGPQAWRLAFATCAKL